MPAHPTIALIEDDPSFSRAVSRFLRVSGYEVFYAFRAYFINKNLKTT